MTPLIPSSWVSFVEDDTATTAVAPVATPATPTPAAATPADAVPDAAKLPAIADAALPVPAAIADAPNAGKTTTEAAAAPIAKADAFKAFLVHCLAFPGVFWPLSDD